MTHSYTTKLIRDPLKTKSDDWRDTAHKWLVTINGVDFDYYAGVAYREALKTYGCKDEYDRLKNLNLTDLGLARLLKVSKATPPKLDDVLWSLCQDAMACGQSFDDWCADCGYDTDSHKALDTYLLCQNAGLKLRQAKINVAAERERLEVEGY